MRLIGEKSANSDNVGRVSRKPNVRAATQDPFLYLSTVDPKLAVVIEAHERCPLPERKEKAPSGQEAFVALVRAIVSQQLSGKAADTIYARVEALSGGALGDPRALATMADESLRGAGLSGAKTRGVKDLANHVLQKKLQLDKLHEQEDEAVINALIQVKGIGRWTAEMFLMFRLGRPDILSTADLGLRKGLMILYGLSDLPDPKTMEQLTNHWRPFRSVGSWYLWRVAEGAPPHRKATSGAIAKKAIAKKTIAKKAIAKKAIAKKTIAKKVASKPTIAKRPAAKR